MRWRWRAPGPEPLDETTRAWLTETVDIPGEQVFPWLPAETVHQPRYETMRCQHCQGVHFRACPKVQSLRFHENGTIAQVDYWPEGSYDDSGTIWPELVFTDPEG